MNDAQGPAHAPALNPSQLIPNIVRYCLTEGDAARLELDLIFMSATFRAHQIVRLFEFASDVLPISLTIMAMARAFETDHSVVERAQIRGYEEPPARGRHPELGRELEQELVDWITNKASDNKAVNRTEFLHYCVGRFVKHITRGLVDSFLTRHTAELFKTKSVPQESPRLDVPRVFLEAAIEAFREHVHHARAELVFHLDEIKISEWEDRVARKVIVAATMREQTIVDRVHRNLKHTSLVVCISAAGEHMRPFLVSSQATDALETRLKQMGFRMGVDLILRKRIKPYMSVELFDEYISRVLLPVH